MSVCVLPDFLRSDECEAAVTLFQATRPASILDPSAVIARDSIRRGRTAFLAARSEESRALVDRVSKVLHQANEEVYRFALAGVEPLQLAEYREGDGYDFHLDLGPGSAALRKLSATIQLSNPKDYDGGDLELWGTKTPPRERGSIVIFPSYLLHRVTPVARGRRLALVAWAVGLVPFR